MIGRIVFVWLFFFSAIGFCQEMMQEDILELKNGKFIYGKILKHIPNKEIRLQTQDSSIFVIPTIQIAVIRQGPALYRKPAYQLDKSNAPKPSTPIIDSSDILEPHKKKGYSLHVKGSYLFLNSYSANINIGRLFNPYVMLAIGSGIEKYRNLGNGFQRLQSSGISSSQVQEDYFIPVVISARFFTSRKRLSLTSSLDAGYSFYLPGIGAKTEYGSYYNSTAYHKAQAGGFVASTSIGLRAFISQNTAITYEMGIKAQAYAAQEIDLSNQSSSKGAFTSTTIFLSDITVWNVVPFLSIGILF